MATLSELIQEHAALPPVDQEWLRLLVSDWQLLSDLSFADLVLWVRSSARRWQAVAHVRPTTGQTVYFRDQVGLVAGAQGQGPLVEALGHDGAELTVEAVGRPAERP